MLNSQTKILYNSALCQSGYGQVGADFLQKLYYNTGLTNIRVETDWRSPYQAHGPEVANLINKLGTTNFDSPEIVYNLWNPICAKMYDISVPHIIETVFETNIIQKNWVDICNQFDQTWLPSKFSFDAFETSGVVNCKLLPYGFEFWDSKEVIPKIMNDTRYKFLFINQWSERKNAYETVESFCKTFKRNDNVVLYIRSFVLGGLGLTNDDIYKQIAEIKNRYPDSPQIILLDFFTDDKLPKLYNSVDCLVSCSAGEGVGRTIVEAMSQELPVITTNWSAMTEYCTTNNSFLIDYDLVPVNVPKAVAKLYYFEEPGMKWAAPDFDQFTDCMKALVADPVIGVRKGKQASKDVRAQFDWEKCLPPRIKAMEEAVTLYE